VLTYGVCDELVGDTYPDLVLKFNTEDMLEAIETEEINDVDEVILTLEGNYIFNDESTPFTAEDTIQIKDKGKHNKSKEEHNKK